MAKFTKWNNPRKKKNVRRNPDYNERMILAAKEMMIDEKLGYSVQVSFYMERWNLNGKKQKTD